MPRNADLPDRLSAALAVVHRIFDEGCTGDPVLCAEALRLGRLLAELTPDEPEVTGLLALMLPVEARRPARRDADGVLVPLPEQDRARWDRALIAEGQEPVRRRLRRNRPGRTRSRPPSTRCTATRPPPPPTGARSSPCTTGWWPWHRRPVVALNRTVVVAGTEEPATALELVDTLGLGRYHGLHAVRADLLCRPGRAAEAAEYGRAAEPAPSEAERACLERRRRGTRQRAPGRRRVTLLTPTRLRNELQDMKGWCLHPIDRKPGPGPNRPVHPVRHP
ncbi:RNA polymerase ECF-subfamily sigma factor [Streptomyces hygroscopicus subsp. limoneus]|nr:RNA polymerase ECF-subfamily sigma factor [Streptomyces hygroscopicus subsp. limoneus]